MSIDTIPKSFWHSISLSVLITTIGLVYISNKAGNLTLKYKDFQFATAKATDEIEEAKRSLESVLSEREAEIAKLRAEIGGAQKALVSAEKQMADIQSNLGSQDYAKSAALIGALRKRIHIPDVIDIEQERSDRESGKQAASPQLKNVQDKIKSLEQIQQQIQGQTH